MKARLARRAGAATVAAIAALAAIALLTAVAWPAGAGADVTTGAVAGDVTGADSPVCVLVLDATGQAVADAASDQSGVYTVPGVPAGTWTVEFVPDGGCLGFDTGIAIQYYHDASTPSSATPVSVAAGQTTSGIDAALVAGATIKGTVSDPAGAGLGGVCVVLEDTAGNPVVRQPTDPNGNYVLDQLPPGRFVVQFVDDDCAGEPAGYASAYYPDATTLAGAQVIQLRAGQPAGEIDATLTPLPGAGGAGSGGGTGTTAPTIGSPTGPATAGPSTPTSAGGIDRRGPSARIALLAIARGRWTVDARQRLHLRLRCAGPERCRVTVTVRRVRRISVRLTGGRRAGSRNVTIRPGHTATVLVALHGVRRGGLWVALGLRGQPPSLTTVLPIRWKHRLREPACGQRQMRVPRSPASRISTSAQVRNGRQRSASPASCSAIGVASRP